MPQTAVERELVLRLASLLWRLRRATAIETGLFEINDAVVAGHQPARAAQQSNHERVIKLTVRTARQHTSAESNAKQHRDSSHLRQPDHFNCLALPRHSTLNVELARRYARLTHLENGGFERLNRYETSLWRQIGQVLLILNFLQRSR